MASNVSKVCENIFDIKKEIDTDFEKSFQLMNSGFFLTTESSADSKKKGHDQIKNAKRDLEQTAQKALRKYVVIYNQVKPVVKELLQLRNKVQGLKERNEKLQNFNDSIFSDISFEVEDDHPTSKTPSDKEDSTAFSCSSPKKRKHDDQPNSVSPTSPDGPSTSKMPATSTPMELHDDQPNTDSPGSPNGPSISKMPTTSTPKKIHDD
jgi:hypothetical protein